MKRILFILLFLSPFILKATTYYVSTTGSSDNYAGTFAQPWATWNKAFDTAEAGDTVFIRGGVYYSSGTNTQPTIAPYAYVPRGHSGTRENPICIFAFPGEKPVLDCHGQYSNSSIVSGIDLISCQYIHLKGLTIRNVYQRVQDKLAQAISIQYTANLTFENMTIYNVSGRGVGGEVLTGYYDEATTPETILCDTTRWLNCDWYNLCDTLSTNAGNAADGIKITIDGRTDDAYGMPYWYLYGCRVWNYSDDAFDIGGSGIVIHDNCWVSSTDKYYVACGDSVNAIEGNGFKEGGVFCPLYAPDSLGGFHWRQQQNCIAVHCAGAGFYDLCYEPYLRTNGLIYNNTSYHNKMGYYSNHNASFRPRTTVYRNNIAYLNLDYPAAIYYPSIYTESNNTWDATQDSTWPGWIDAIDMTVSAADFVSLDTVGMWGARKADNSLPDINFGHLVAESDMKAIGYDVGMTQTPDIGVDWTFLDAGVPEPDPDPVPEDTVTGDRFIKSSSGKFMVSGGILLKYNDTLTATPILSSETDILTFTVAAQTSSSVNATNHTVGIDVPYGTTVTSLVPTITISSGATIDPTSGTAQNFTSPVEYTVTAENSTTTQAWDATVTVGEAPSETQIIADHSVVDLYDDIPQQWIDSVKKMWVAYPGESHAMGVLKGLELLEESYPSYPVDAKYYTEGGNPDPYTTTNLRASTAKWGDYSNATGWIYEQGEEDWYTNATAISRTKTGITYASHNGFDLTAIGFGWCWDHTRLGPSVERSTGTDPVTGNHWYGRSEHGAAGDLPWGLDDADNSISGNTINLDDYLSATQEFIDYCADSIPAKVFFTTAPMDDVNGEYSEEELPEVMYQGSIKNQRIRDYVSTDPTRILFDYADILNYDDNGDSTIMTWNGNTFMVIADGNITLLDMYAHIGRLSTVRLAKAMWWMLARIAGWDGN